MTKTINYLMLHETGAVSAGGQTYLQQWTTFTNDQIAHGFTSKASQHQNWYSDAAAVRVQNEQWADGTARAAAALTNGPFPSAVH